ncbi:hypothetical protein OF846_004375 [Rhodotorula toruloides]|nr:hypothetical protein OF846_004375 [Rhodotorula toruloides]
MANRPGPTSIDQVNHGSCRLSPEARSDYAVSLVQPPKGAGKKAKLEEEARMRLKQASLELKRKSESPSPAPDSAPPSPKKAKKGPTLFKSPSPVLLDARDSTKVKKEELDECHSQHELARLPGLRSFCCIGCAQLEVPLKCRLRCDSKELLCNKGVLAERSKALA